MVLNKQLIFYFHMMGNILVSLLSTWFVRFAKFDMRQNIFCTLYNYVKLNCLNYRRLFRDFRPTREVFKHIDMSSLRVKSCKYLCSALITIVNKWFLACHTYCDTGHSFIMVISEDPWHSHLLPGIWQMTKAAENEISWKDILAFDVFIVYGK